MLLASESNGKCLTVVMRFTIGRIPYVVMLHLSCWQTLVIAGLRELLVDSGVYAGCTVDQILIGKQFNRGIRAYTLVYEVLMTLWLSAFFKWCSEEGHMGSIEENIWQSMLLLHEQFCDPNRNTVDIS